MTNEELIAGLCLYFDGYSDEESYIDIVIGESINKIRENDKLKSEINVLNTRLQNATTEFDLCCNLQYENGQLKDENKKLLDMVYNH